jgi:hypothetical protein
MKPPHLSYTFTFMFFSHFLEKRFQWSFKIILCTSCFFLKKSIFSSQLLTTKGTCKIPRSSRLACSRPLARAWEWAYIFDLAKDPLLHDPSRIGGTCDLVLFLAQLTCPPLAILLLARPGLCPSGPAHHLTTSCGEVTPPPPRRPTTSLPAVGLPPPSKAFIINGGGRRPHPKQSYP